MEVGLWEGHGGAQESGVLRIGVVRGLPGAPVCTTGMDQEVWAGMGTLHGSRGTVWGAGVRGRSRGLGRDPSVVDGDGDEKGKGLGGSSSAQGAAPWLPHHPTLTSVSAPLKIWHRVSPQDLAIALQTLRFVWFSCSKFTFFFSFLEGENSWFCLEKWNPTRGWAVGRAAAVGLGRARWMG